MPPLQNLPLPEDDILVEDIHSKQATARSHVSPFRANNSLLNRRASRVAARLTRPGKCLGKFSSGSPSERCSNTCQTIIRVPLKVGLPWQTFGSATIYFPSLMRRGLPFVLIFSKLPSAEPYRKSPVLRGIREPASRGAGGRFFNMCSGNLLKAPTRTLYPATFPAAQPTIFLQQFWNRLSKSGCDDSHKSQ